MKVLCPKCNATGDDPCRTASGKVATSPHVYRYATVRTPRHLEQAIVAATAQAYWLTAIDRQAIDVALVVASKIDDQIWTAEHVALGSLFEDAALGRLEGGIVYDVQTLATILTALGLTPKGRTELRLPEHDTDDELATILELYGD